MISNRGPKNGFKTATVFGQENGTTSVRVDSAPSHSVVPISCPPGGCIFWTFGGLIFVPTRWAHFLDHRLGGNRGQKVGPKMRPPPGQENGTTRAGVDSAPSNRWSHFFAHQVGAFFGPPVLATLRNFLRVGCFGFGGVGCVPRYWVRFRVRPVLSICGRARASGPWPGPMCGRGLVLLVGPAGFCGAGGWGCGLGLGFGFGLGVWACGWGLGLGFGFVLGVWVAAGGWGCGWGLCLGLGLWCGAGFEFGLGVHGLVPTRGRGGLSLTRRGVDRGRRKNGREDVRNAASGHHEMRRPGATKCGTRVPDSGPKRCPLFAHHFCLNHVTWSQNCAQILGAFSGPHFNLVSFSLGPKLRLPTPPAPQAPNPDTPQSPEQDAPRSP